ncbi:phytoene desaturase family protein [Amycolatopsis sp. MEPSY49]|uniref:phytoene desaturase family protein n=1 Tax=Amycolatopsis sp. MEPSY49 TaxID=3151600 RepID=UPI003EF24F6C
MIIYRRDLKKKTRGSLSRYSARDATTYERCKAIADRFTPALSGLFFSSPRATQFAAYLDRISTAFRGLVDPESLGRFSARDLIDRLFETDEVRTLFYLLAAEFSGDLDEPGGDVGLLGYVFWLLGRRALPLGGMIAVPEALAEAATAAGADLRLESEVERVLTEDGVVAGVRLRGGDVLTAPMVAASIGHGAGLLERDVLSASELSALSRFREAGSNLLGSYAACLDRAPEYKSGAHNPDINTCAQTFIGLDTTREVVSHLHDVRSGRLPAPCGAVRVNTLWDPAQAPAGHHVAGADCAFPDGLTGDHLTGIERTYPAAFARMWSEYAPGIGDHVLAQRVSLTANVNRKMLVREGDAQYRGGVRGMYFCGSSTHPGGGVHGACGVNAFGVMMADRRRGAVTRSRP